MVTLSALPPTAKRRGQPRRRRSLPLTLQLQMPGPLQVLLQVQI